MQSTWKPPPSACSRCPDDVGDAPADAGVDLVEDRAVLAAGDVASVASVLSASMIRESSPPETMRASGRRSSPGFGETKNSAASMPRAVHRSVVGGAVVEPDLEARALHRELGELPLELPRERRRRVPRAGRRAAARPRQVALPCRRELALELGDALVGRVEVAPARPRSASRRAITSASVGPYFRFSRSSSASRSSTCCSRAGEASMSSRVLAQERAPGPRAAT